MPNNTHSATVSGVPIGPGKVTAGLTYRDVKQVLLDFQAGTCHITTGDRKTNSALDITNITTLTDTITAGNHVISIS